MKRLNQIVRLETQRGTSIVTANGVITPISQALFVRYPYGGFVWNRPIAIEVQTEQGASRVRILDVTLMVRLGLYLSGFILAVIFLLINRQDI